MCYRDRDDSIQTKKLWYINPQEKPIVIYRIRDIGIKPTFFKSPNTKALIFSAIVLAISSGLLQLWLTEQQYQQQQNYINSYTEMLTTASSSQLGSFIHTQDKDSLEAVAKGLYENDSIFKVSIYQRDGSLMSKLEADELPDDLRSVVADIYYQDKKNGYLTVYFSPTAQASLISQVVAQPVMIWIISGISWGLLLFAISFKKIRQWWKNRKPKENTAMAGKELPSQNQLLRQLFKHSNGKKEQQEDGSQYVIKANWERLNERTTHQLLTVFNRWLPKNNIYFLSFKQSLLILGKDSQKLESNQLIQLQVLVRAMRQLKLEPAILIHNLNFDRDIYETFFEVMEPGIWLESDIKHQSFIDSEQHIELEIESIGEVELTRVPDIEAQQRSGIERQARFLLGG
ncbi:hypothetical protein [Kangiella sp.]|uniref:hypothetical protein n=1 Tax=Kangiella sp. TaxID=1920245 RepID=UPI003A8CF657